MGPAKYFDSVHTQGDRGYAPDNNRFSLDRIWPPTPFCLIEGAWHAGDRRAAALLSQRLINRAFQTMDLRERVRDKPLPGVSYELWDINIQAPDRPVVSNFLNAEGYGWGAVTTLFLIREIFGFREKDGATDSFVLAPYFPEELLRRRQSFTIRNLRFRKLLLAAHYRFEGERLRVLVRGLPAGTQVLRGGEVVRHAEADGGIVFGAENRAILELVVPRSIR